MKTKKLAGIVLAIILCGALLVGCYNPANVMKINNKDVPAGVYLFYQFSAVQQAMSEYGDSTITGTAIYDVEIEGTPAREWINNKTLELVKRHVFIESEFERLGLSFTSTEQNSNKYMADYQWQQSYSILRRNGISYESFALVVDNSYKESAVIKALYDTDGEKALPEEDFETYFHEHYTKLDYLQFPYAYDSGEALSEEDAATLLDLAKTMRDYAKQTGSMETAFIQYYQQVLDLMAKPAETGEDEEAADEETADEEAATDEDTTVEEEAAVEVNAELYAATAKVGTVVNDALTSPDADFIKAVFNAKAGDYKVYVKKEASLIILYHVIGLEDADKIEDYHNQLLMEMAEDPYEAYVTATVDTYAISVNERARKHYSLDNIKFS